MTSRVIDSFLQVDVSHCDPFVKWAGGKRQLLSRFDSMIPSKFDRYFEPFLGGGAMFFYLVSDRNMSLRSYLSDVNRELVTAYQVVKNNVEELIQMLGAHQIKYDMNPSEYYYKLRDQIKPVTEIDRTARFITLNRTCFNGLYRVNRSGAFNVPIGRSSNGKNQTICDATNLRNVSTALNYSNVSITVSDYKAALSETKQEDFVYLDPPYLPISETALFTSYSASGFGKTDHIELSKVFVDLHNKGCKVLLSNSNTQFIKELYSNFTVEEISASRAINSNAARRGKDQNTELVISNYKLEALK